MALILAVSGMADFLREGEIGVLKRAHDRRVHADVQRLAAVWIPRRIEQPVNRFGIRAFGRS